MKGTLSPQLESACFPHWDIIELLLRRYMSKPKERRSTVSLMLGLQDKQITIGSPDHKIKHAFKILAKPLLWVLSSNTSSGAISTLCPPN